MQWSLVVLAVLWGAALIPQWLADRHRDRPVESMASFHKRLWQLEQLDRRSTAAVGSSLAREPRPAPEIGEPSAGLDDDDTPGGMSGGISRRALRRRRQVFFFLLSSVVISLAALVLLRTIGAVAVHASSLVLFTGYVTLLVRHHQRALEQDTKVRYLSPIRVPRPAVVVLRSGTAR